MAHKFWLTTVAHSVECVPAKTGGYGFKRPTLRLGWRQQLLTYDYLQINLCARF